MLENDRPADAKTVTHIDRCLSCLACMTTCPSGVNYMHLIDHARAHIEKTWKRPLLDRMYRNLLAFVLPYPKRFAGALAMARLAKPFAPYIGKIPALTPIAAMLKLAPGKLERHPKSQNPASSLQPTLENIASQFYQDARNQFSTRPSTRLQLNCSPF